MSEEQGVGSLDDLTSELTLDEASETVSPGEVAEATGDQEAEPQVQQVGQAGETKAKGVPGAGAVGLSDADKKRIAEQVVRLAGDGAVVRHKQRDIPLASFSPDEVIHYFSKGFGAEASFQQAAEMKKAIQAEREAIARERQNYEAGMEQVRRFMAEKTGAAPGHGRPSGITRDKALELLQPAEDDGPEVRALKEMVLATRQELDEFKGRSAVSEYQAAEKDLLTRVNTLKQQYPCASEYELIAVKSMYKDADLEELARKSHELYTSDDFIKNVLKQRPDFLRELSDAIIKRYLQGKVGGKTAPGRRVGGGNVISAPEKKKEPITDNDWDKAEAAAKERIAEAAQSIAEEMS